MIESIQIENLRSIKSLFIKPRNLYAFIGPNSTGKTNVLKAIDLGQQEVHPYSGYLAFKNQS